MLRILSVLFFQFQFVSFTAGSLHSSGWSEERCLLRGWAIAEHKLAGHG